MNEKRKLIRRFGWDCFWINLIYIAIILTSLPQLFLLLNFYFVFRNKGWQEEAKFKWRKPTLIELAEFFILGSAVSLIIVVAHALRASEGQLMQQSIFIILLWILTLSFALYGLAKDLATLKTPTALPN